MNIKTVEDALVALAEIDRQLLIIRDFLQTKSVAKESIPVSALKLSTRTYTAISNGRHWIGAPDGTDITTVSQLLMFNPRQWMKWRGMGSKCIVEIIVALHKAGLAYRKLLLDVPPEVVRLLKANPEFDCNKYGIW